MNLALLFVVFLGSASRKAVKIIVAAKLYYSIRVVANRVRSLTGLPVINVLNFSRFSYNSARMFQEDRSSVSLQTCTGVTDSYTSGLAVGTTFLQPTKSNASLAFHSDQVPGLC
jgi:hypothetical protein